MENKKKKMSLTQFFIIYIAILALILLGVSACTGNRESGGTKVLENASPSSGVEASPSGDSLVVVNPTEPASRHRLLFRGLPALREP